DHAPGSRLEPVRRCELALQTIDRMIEALVCASCQLHLSKVRRHGIGLALHGAQYVERVDVARAFPDRVEGRFAIQARQDRFLYVAVAAMTFERFRNDGDRALACPELRDL